jgi:hypothetical protein
MIAITTNNSTSVKARLATRDRNEGQADLMELMDTLLVPETYPVLFGTQWAFAEAILSG